MIKKIFLFLVINFVALAIGGLSTSDGVISDWYINLTKAPWTPPGWVFGVAWTLVMICFSVFMAYLYAESKNRKKVITLFIIQWILNVIWNPIFFHYHAVLFGLLIISSLALVVTYFLFNYKELMKGKSLLILPYFIWLIIATSLNAYILFYN